MLLVFVHQLSFVQVSHERMELFENEGRTVSPVFWAGVRTVYFQPRSPGLAKA